MVNKKRGDLIREVAAGLYLMGVRGAVLAEIAGVTEGAVHQWFGKHYKGMDRHRINNLEVEKQICESIFDNLREEHGAGGIIEMIETQTYLLRGLHKNWAEMKESRSTESKPKRSLWARIFGGKS